MSTSETDYAIPVQVIESCVVHGNDLLAAQLPAVEAQNYDYMPAFKEMTIHFFLIGVMWRYGEQFDLPTCARDRAFICLAQKLINEGMSFRVAKKRIAFLKSYSRSSDGNDNRALAIAHEAGDKEGALVAIFDTFRNNPEASGARWRFISRTKPVAAILAIAGLAVSMLLGTSLVQAIGIGIVIGISTLAIGMAIFSQMGKKEN